MATSKIRPFSEEVPTKFVPEDYITLDLMLTLRVVVTVKPDSSDDDLSPLQRKVMRDIKGKGDDEEENEAEVTYEKKITTSRFLGHLIEGYYGVTDYTVVMFNGDSFNVTNSPNEIDRKLLEYNARTAEK